MSSKSTGGSAAGASADQPIRLRYVFDEATFLQANRALWRRQRERPTVKWRALAFPALLPVGAALAWWYGMWFVFAAIVGLNLLHFAFDWPITRAFAKRQFGHLPAANRRFEWRIDETGLHLKLDGGEKAFLPWPALSQVVEDEDGFLLIQPENVHHWLPRAAFADDAEIARFRKWSMPSGNH